ncbi:MAG: hypothetical protein R6U32_07125 [Candidatus Woesearchaeota archaeon]
MKIMICGSMHFARDMLEAKQELENLGHEAMVPDDTHECVENPDLNMDFEHCMRTQIDKKCFDKIAESDAILVLNHPKNGIEGYVGGATLMEIGLARHLNKRIFMMNELPADEELRYALEIRITEPVILNGNLSRIR